MKFLSTRGSGPVSLEDALLKGIADDGGLFVADQLPHFEISDFDAAQTVVDVGERLLQPFFAGTALAADLRDILRETYTFPVPVEPLPESSLSLLELFHGPTAAFKDVGAGFLAACLTRLAGDVANPLTILVATSGDTGGAVAAAFNGRPGIRVVILFPDGRVSARQQAQLTCWGDNVLSLRVGGAFDDCQALVKQALADKALSDCYRFSSANSINIGRLLPQMTYYAHASLEHLRQRGQPPGFIIPTGNLGNAFACFMARQMGLPIGPIVLATNANRTIVDFLETSEWCPRASIATLASAMDVGDPSNMERLRNQAGEAADIGESVLAASVSDEEIREEIGRVYRESGVAICPHTATASHCWRQTLRKRPDSANWIAVATAHPAKFETIVEPLIANAVELPDSLEALLERPQQSVALPPSMLAFSEALQAEFG